jgi:hypothetical protein
MGLWVPFPVLENNNSNPGVRGQYEGIILSFSPHLPYKNALYTSKQGILSAFPLFPIKFPTPLPALESAEHT